MIPRLDSWTSACQNLCQGFHEPFRTLKHRENQGLRMAARLKPTLRAKNRVVVSNQKSTSTLALQKPEQSPALWSSTADHPLQGCPGVGGSGCLGRVNARPAKWQRTGIHGFAFLFKRIAFTEKIWSPHTKYHRRAKLNLPKEAFSKTKHRVSIGQEGVPSHPLSTTPPYFHFDPLSLWGSYPAFVVPRCPQCSDPQVEMWFGAMPRHHHNDILNTGNLGNVWKLMPIHVCMHAHTNILTFNRRTNIQMYRGHAYVHTCIHRSDFSKQGRALGRCKARIALTIHFVREVHLQDQCISTNLYHLHLYTYRERKTKLDILPPKKLY